ncbi:MAG: tyrosine-type recombinase/integrase [Nanobdellota archaeon]
MKEKDFIKLWLFHRANSDQTVRSYTAVIKKFKEYIEKKPLKKASALDVSAFIAQLECSDRTKKHHIGVLKSLYRFGFEVEYFDKNFMEAYRSPRIKNDLAGRILSEADIILMINLEPVFRNKVILKFLYNTGIRASELCNIKIKDLKNDKEEGVITIFGKGNKSRQNRINSRLWMDVQKLAEDKTDEQFLFTKIRGRKEQISYAQLYQIVKNAAKRINKEKTVSVHTFRHSHITHALNRNCPAHIAQAQVGHSSLATTGMYAHIFPKESSGSFLIDI